jgi:hypothetical protein
MRLDVSVGSLLLRADLWDLKLLTRLPDLLERTLQLPMAAVALRYALGHESTVPRELLTGPSGTPPMAHASVDATTDDEAISARADGPMEATVAALAGPSGSESVASSVPTPPSADDATAHAMHSLFRRWRDQPVAEHLPATPMLGTEVTVTLSAVILGCTVSVDATNRAPYVQLALT